MSSSGSVPHSRSGKSEPIESRPNPPDFTPPPPPSTLKSKDSIIVNRLKMEKRRRQRESALASMSPEQRRNVMAPATYKPARVLTDRQSIRDKLFKKGGFSNKEDFKQGHVTDPVQDRENQRGPVDRRESESEKTKTGENPDWLPKVTKSQQYMAVIAAFLVNALTLGGVGQAFGVFQEHYGSEAAVKDGVVSSDDIKMRPAIAAIGALGNGGVISALCAIWCLPLLPRLGKKIGLVCFLGTLLMTTGLATAAASTRLAHILATQGLVFGIGAGILFNTLPTILPDYFDGHTGWAQGVSQAGASVGGVIVAPVTRKLLDSVGTQLTLAIFASVYFFLGCLASILAQPARGTSKRAARFVTWKDFKDPKFLSFMAANLLVTASGRNPMSFGPDFSMSLGYSPDTAAYLLAGASGIGIISRPSLGWVADKVGHQNTLLLTTFVYVISTFSNWLPAAVYSNRPLWIISVVFTGLLNGAFLQLSTSVAQRVFGHDLYYCYSGPFQAIRGVGYVIGAPIGGQFITRVRDADLHGPDFVRLVVETGVNLTIATLCLAQIRWADAKKGGWKWIG